MLQKVTCDSASYSSRSGHGGYKSGEFTNEDRAKHVADLENGDMALHDSGTDQTCQVFRFSGGPCLYAEKWLNFGELLSLLLQSKLYYYYAQQCVVFAVSA